LKKAFRQPEPSKTAVFLEVDSSENGLFNRLLGMVTSRHFQTFPVIFLLLGKKSRRRKIERV
jgi:hypothetical protein